MTTAKHTAGLDDEIIAYQRAEREFAATPVGAAFVKFERLIGRAWITDSTSNSNSRMKRDWDAANAARSDCVAIIRATLNSHDDLLSGGEKMRAIMVRAQTLLRMYLEPGDRRVQTDEQIVNALIGLFDGTDQREAESVWNAARAKATKAEG